MAEQMRKKISLAQSLLFPSMKSARKLVLHIDVNNTIFVGDSKTKLTVLEGVLNEYLTEILWGNVGEDDHWQPLKNPIATLPPTINAVTYYRYAEYKFANAGKPRSEFKAHIRRFTQEETGRKFRSYVDRVKAGLKFTKDDDVDCRLIESILMQEYDGFYYRILPSYFKLLDYLLNSEREFSIILRTFGSDGHIALQATQLYIDNKHPDLKFPKGKTLSVNHQPKHIIPSTQGLSITTDDGHDVTCSNQVYNIFSKSSGVQLYLDNYDWWKANDFVSHAGKPLLVDPSDTTVQHILFDDNIRSWEPDDNIVRLMVKEGNEFVHKDCRELDGLCLLRTDLFESILNEDYFIEKVQMCEKNYEDYQSKKGNDLCIIL